MRRRSESIRDKLLPAGAFLLLLLVWWGIAASGLVPGYMLPSPVDVIRAFIADFPNLAAHAWVSVEEALLGLLLGTLLAFGLACAMDRFLNLERAVLPLLVASQTIPTIAIAPLLVLWMGFGVAPKIALVLITTFFPVAVGLLDAMSDVRRSTAGGLAFPEMQDLLMHDPVTSELEDGGRLITLSFRENVEELLIGWQTDLSCLIAAVACTLSTFVPGVTAVCVRVGDTLMTEMDSTRYSVGTILGGLVRRETAEMFLTGSANVFFEKNGRLAMCEKPVERDMTDSPRAVLEAILEGPDRREREAGFLPTIPENVSGDDILGIAAEDNMLLVNLSEMFRAAIEAAGPEKEALLCYSIVNTLCLNSGMKRVCFFFEGKQAETIAGSLYWGGEFMYNPGM